MLRAFGRELWLADGPPVRFLGLVPYPTRMAVARLESGALWVWSPIALDRALADEVDALGPVRQLVAPNKLHHLALAQWAHRYPEARLHAAPGLAAKRPDLAFASELGDEPDPAWAGQIEQVVFRGSRILDEVVFFHRPSRCVLVADLVQRLEPAQVSAWLRGLLRVWGVMGERGSTPLEWRLLWWGRRAGRAALAQALAWSPERLVVAHGRCAAGDGRDALATGLRWLGGAG
jgi:hypothetical protein